MVDARKLRHLFSDGDEVTFLQETRNDIAHAILAHPEQSPSVGEVHYLTGGNKSNIRHHLDRLEETSYVRKIESEGTSRDEPSVFYTLTGEGKDQLDEDVLEKQKLEEYEQTFEELDGHWGYTDDQIRRYLDAERPE